MLKYNHTQFQNKIGKSLIQRQDQISASKAHIHNRFQIPGFVLALQ
jgi:hypothetical protein